MTEAAGCSRIHLLDVSISGALAHAVAPPPPGTRVRIECGELSRGARTCWREASRFGLRFDLPLRTEELEALAPPSPGAGKTQVRTLA
jgi:hypothetical protein